MAMKSLSRIAKVVSMYPCFPSMILPIIDNLCILKRKKLIQCMFISR
jgi:hypothetical protein